MIKYRILFLLLISGLIYSCEKDSYDVTDSDVMVIGSWIKPNYNNDNTTVLERSNKLRSNDYGIEFMSDGSLVERKNSSFCGTPPITYADYNGTWSINGSIIQITVDYWGGQSEYEWEIVSIGYKKIKIKRLREELL